MTHKPGAMAGSAALARARTMGVFTDVHDRFWALARRQHGDGPGTCRLIEVLLLHRRMPADQVLAGIEAALKVGATDPAVVAIEARRLADASLAPVVELEGRLARYERPAPSLAGYDQLLPTGTAPARDLPADGPLASVTTIGEHP